jgi:uncharacterized membrane protein
VVSTPLVELDAQRNQALKSVGHLSYALHTVVAVGAVVPFLHASVLLLVVAFIIDLVKRDEARGTWQESHFGWRIRTVIWAGVLYAVTLPLWFLFILPGYFAWVVISIWFLYRIIRGWVNLNDNQPIAP